MQKFKTISEFVNESRDMLKAQEVCKSALFQLERRLESVYMPLIDRGILNVKSPREIFDISPYNDGYEMKFNYDGRSTDHAYIDILWDRGLPKETAKKFGKLEELVRINLFLHPDSFFDSYLEEGSGASFTGRVFKLGGYESFREKVETKNDIKEVPEKFLRANESGIKEAEELVQEFLREIKK